jgi:hypothetical protein
VAERLGSGLQSRPHGFESRHSLYEQTQNRIKSQRIVRFCVCSRGKPLGDGVRSHQELLAGRSLDVFVERVGAEHAGE